MTFPQNLHFNKGVLKAFIGLPRWLSGKKLRLPMQEIQVRSLGREDLLEEFMATHSSILAGRNPWREEPRGLQSMRSQRVGHD